MMKGSEKTVASSEGGGAETGSRKKMFKFTEDDKENFNVYGGDEGLKENKSPLPVGFPRLPLQDITAVLRPLNSNSDEEDPRTGVRKPFTRSQGLRKAASVQTTIFPGRTSKTVNRGASSRSGLSKTRKKQVMKIAVDESLTVMLSGDPGPFKEETVHHTINVSSSVNLTDQTQGGQKIEDFVSPVETTSVKAAEETNASGCEGATKIPDKEDEAKAMDFSETAVTDTEHRRATPEEPLVSSKPSTSTGNQFYQDQKKRKPLSGRSSVSSFR